MGNYCSCSNLWIFNTVEEKNKEKEFNRKGESMSNILI